MSDPKAWFSGIDLEAFAAIVVDVDAVPQMTIKCRYVTTAGIKEIVTFAVDQSESNKLLQQITGPDHVWVKGYTGITQNQPRAYINWRFVHKIDRPGQPEPSDPTAPRDARILYTFLPDGSSAAIGWVTDQHVISEVDRLVGSAGYSEPLREKSV